MIPVQSCKYLEVEQRFFHAAHLPLTTLLFITLNQKDVGPATIGFRGNTDWVVADGQEAKPILHSHFIMAAQVPDGTGSRWVIAYHDI